MASADREMEVAPKGPMPRKSQQIDDARLTLVSYHLHANASYLAQAQDSQQGQGQTPVENVERFHRSFASTLGHCLYPPKAFRLIPSCRLLQTILEAVFPACLNDPTGRGQGPINLPQRVGQVAQATKSVTARDPAPVASQACRRKPAGLPGPMCCPDDHPHRIPVASSPCTRSLAAPDQLPNGVSEFVRRGQEWYLIPAVKTEDVPSQDGPHFDLDLALANLAVLSGPDVVRFLDGRPLRYTRGRYLRYRQALQRKDKTGMVKRSKERKPRWIRCANHRVSRQTVDTVAAQGGVLHVEKLPGIRDRTKKTRKVNRMLHAWPLEQLFAFIRHKAT